MQERLTLSKNCRRALWHFLLLQTSAVETRLVQGLMYAERYFLHVSFKLQAFAAFRQSFFLTTAGSPEEKDSIKKKVRGIYSQLQEVWRDKT